MNPSISPHRLPFSLISTWTRSKRCSRWKRSIITLALKPLHHLCCPHPPLHVIATPRCPAHSVTRLATVNASATHCNTPKTPTSRQSALGGQPNQANTISTAPATHSTTSTTDITNVASQDVMECAGNASLHSIDPSDPLLPLQLDADVDWNADTGATSHMMPHRHWLCNYTPKHVPIKLADNAVVYSAGVGSVVFHPNLEGKRGRVVEFSNVLHVPHLHNNLLAVLYLTRHSSFVVHINATHMSFAGLGSPGQRGRLEDTRQWCQRSLGSVYSVLRMYVAMHPLVLHMYRTTLGIGPLHLVMRVGSEFSLSFLQSTACSTVSSLIFVSRFFSVAIHTSTPRVTLYHIPCSCTPS